MRALARRLQGARLVGLDQRRRDLRSPLPSRLAERLTGRRWLSFSRRAKYILVEIEGGETLLLHLGMSGRLLLDGPPRGPHEHLTFHFADGRLLRFVDPRRFGMLDLWPSAELAAHPRLAGLGLEPLAPDFTSAALAARFARRRASVKAALMDQRIVVGVGNIYACEALHLARLSPLRPAGAVGPRQLARLVGAVREVLERAIGEGGSSLRDYVGIDGELGNFQSRFLAYDRVGEPCTACGRPIRRIVQHGRSTFYCAACQR